MLYFVNLRFKWIDVHDRSITIDNRCSLKYENEDWRVYTQQLGVIFWLKRFLRVLENRNVIWIFHLFSCEDMKMKYWDKKFPF